ncbi:hypothetical protein LXA43DRAFT_1101015 [Ganoderma leucocontextum]|nr:hypothetical protein LXA43DRAFT_1101015 [Ganoderma leucocontextum]
MPDAVRVTSSPSHRAHGRLCEQAPGLVIPADSGVGRQPTLAWTSECKARGPTAAPRPVEAFSGFGGWPSRVTS